MSNIIICQNCGGENDLGRKYCTECNEKLDLSSVQSKAASGGLSKTEIRKKISLGNKAAKTTSSSIALKTVAIQFLLLVLVLGGLGLIGYTVFLAYKKPSGMPVWRPYADYKNWTDQEQLKCEIDFEGANRAKLDLEDALLNNMDYAGSVNEEQANAWLSRYIQPSTKTLPGGIKVKFDSAYVKFLDDGTYKVFLKYVAFDHPFYMTYRISANLDSGALLVRYRSIKLNSLEIPKMLHDKALGPLDNLENITKPNKKLILGCNILEITEEKLTIKTAIKAPPPEAPTPDGPPQKPAPPKNTPVVTPAPTPAAPPAPAPGPPTPASATPAVSAPAAPAPVAAPAPASAPAPVAVPMPIPNSPATAAPAPAPPQTPPPPAIPAPVSSTPAAVPTP
ncbi:MAG: zinc ribbon domain-containing protein [Verrucomicrobiae bacterium]|nr:zinc ribbon domain-containing protein [Verrucomicrobiae bacterium]